MFARAFHMTVGEAIFNDEVIFGTFIFAFQMIAMVLFDVSASRFFVSAAF